MRAELEVIERIENYLMNKMSAEEKGRFEQELENNTGLAEEVNAQKSVMDTIKRIGIRSIAANAYKKWIMYKWLLRGGIIVLSGSGIFVVYYLLNKEECIPCPNENPAFEFDRPSNCCEDTFVLAEAQENNSDLDTNSFPNSDADLPFPESIVDTCTTEVDQSNPKIYSENGFNTDPETITQHSSANDYEIDLNGNVTKDFYIGRIPEVEASFPGGEAALSEWITRNMRYPNEAIQKGQQGIVTLKFTINLDGSITDIEVSKGVSKSLDQEAVRLVRQMPKWKPARDQGRNVRRRFTLPINFVLAE